MNLVMIDWIDSARPISEWQYLSDYKPFTPIKCTSVGFLVHDTKEVKALAPNVGDLDNKDTVQASGIIHIPTCSISKITKLKEIK